MLGAKKETSHLLNYLCLFFLIDTIVFQGGE